MAYFAYYISKQWNNDNKKSLEGQIKIAVNDDGGRVIIGDVYCLPCSFVYTRVWNFYRDHV
jgi:hypothetical protein